MKKCNSCGAQIDEQAKFCHLCGSADFAAATIPQQAQQPYQQAQQPYQAPATPPVFNSGYQAQNPPYPAQNAPGYQAADNGNGNVLAGFVGAFLFSIIGGLLYFVIYQAGVIAGICGLVIFVLANFGYGLFARTKNKASTAGLIASIAAMVVMIFVAEYFCISFEIYQDYKNYVDITIFDAIEATPDFLDIPEVGDAFVEDLGFAYLFGFAASIGNIANIVKARKQKQQGK